MKKQEEFSIKIKRLQKINSERCNFMKEVSKMLSNNAKSNKFLIPLAKEF